MPLKSRLSSRLHIHNGFHPPLWKFLSSSESGSTLISACNVCRADNLDNRAHRFLKEQGVGSEMAEAIMGIISSIGMANFENNVSCPGSQCPIFTSFGKSSLHILRTL